MVMSNQAPTAPSPIGGPATPQAPISGGNYNGQGAVPFRRATIGRNQIVGTETYTFGAATNILTASIPTIQGSGYFEKLEMDFNLANLTNAANAMVLTEDAPWNTALNILLGDINAPLVYNVNGYYTWLANWFGGLWRNDPMSSWDQTVWFANAIGVNVTANTPMGFRFRLLLSLVSGVRDLIGLSGNQDAGQKFDLGYSVNAGANIWSVQPSGTGTLAVTRTYWSRAVPNAYNNRGLPNQQFPNTFGTLHFTLQARSEAVPVGGSQVQHYVRRLGTTMRAMILVFRSNSSRATAEAAANYPTNINFYAGDQPLYREDYATRKSEMFRRYPMSPHVFAYGVANTLTYPSASNSISPLGSTPSVTAIGGGFNGVLCYDRISDFDASAGEETGNDWLWAEQLNQMRFDITYPSGFGSTANSLDIVTQDFTVPPSAVPAMYAPI